MLSEEALERAAKAAAEGRENWHVMKVYRTGPQLWKIDYGTPDGIETVEIQDTTEAEAEEKIREQLRSRFSN